MGVRLASERREGVWPNVVMALIALAFLVALILTARPGADMAPTSDTAPYCAEDDPCFDCTVHGNQICEPLP